MLIYKSPSTPISKKEKLTPSNVKAALSYSCKVCLAQYRLTCPIQGLQMQEPVTAKQQERFKGPPASVRWNGKNQVLGPG